MNKFNVLKYLTQLVLIASFGYFIAMPAMVESPRKAYAESKTLLQKKAAARKRTSLRLLQRALEEQDPAKQEEMLGNISTTYCYSGYSCKDSLGATFNATASSCKRCRPKADCLACCDNQSSRPAKCKQSC